MENTECEFGNCYSELDEEMAEAPEMVILAESNIMTVDGLNYIVLEVPGFGKNDIDAYFELDVLIIEGYKPNKLNATYQTREFVTPDNFKNKFKLGSRTEVDEIVVLDGICTIRLINVEPEKNYLEVT
ncbi:MAG: Hsp20 family protein [Clostridiales bacterium]|nr:Hsp20 family protein [Clostridiales bacterium]